ncbi:MAG: TIGR04283 family arsenosugar biosynthesis glycosyltransferase [Syntrophobacteraceae bacterium]
MTSQERQLLIFMRYPEHGKVKTRLAGGVGDREALRLHTLLVRRTLGIACDFKRLHPDVSIFLVVEPPGCVNDLARSFPGPWLTDGQAGEHLGERMAHAIRRAFDRGGREVVLIGTDIGDLQPEDLEAAFERMRDETAVLGPAKDGGFYLIGLRRYTAEVFQPVDWGTGTVFDRTADLLRRSGLRVARLVVRRDVDRPADVEWMLRDALFRETVSVVMPTLKDPAVLRPRLQALKDRMWPDDELIVVRGIDEGRLAVHELEARIRVVTAPRGRGIQLNHGARHAGGSVLLFLHDDTDPPDQFPYLIRRAVQMAGVALGCFRLSFTDGTRTLDLIARWANVRSRLFRLPYGDQGLFCRREVFERVGGFRRRYLMEDVDFVRACRAEGDLAMVEDPVLTSPDRYLTRGVLRNSIQNHATMALYRAGMDEERLYRWYYRR